jgi:hypothetical protein
VGAEQGRRVGEAIDEDVVWTWLGPLSNDILPADRIGEQKLRIRGGADWSEGSGTEEREWRSERGGDRQERGNEPIGLEKNRMNVLQFVGRKVAFRKEQRNRKFLADGLKSLLFSEEECAKKKTKIEA